jgi:hypothetical protein
VDDFMESLPESLQSIVRLTNLETALKLVEHRGGTQLAFPPLHLLSAEHDLVKVVGFAELKALCRFFSGSVIYVPLARQYSLHFRDEQVKIDALAGMKTNELARKYNISDRRIRKILHGSTKVVIKKDERQMELF